MGKRERNQLNSYNAIMAVGRANFIEHGHEGATVRDIVGRTPLASGA